MLVCILSDLLPTLSGSRCLLSLCSLGLDNLGERVVHSTFVPELANLRYCLVNGNGLAAVLCRGVVAEADVDLPALDLLITNDCLVVSRCAYQNSDLEN